MKSKTLFAAGLLSFAALGYSQSQAPAKPPQGQAHCPL